VLDVAYALDGLALPFLLYALFQILILVIAILVLGLAD
jgi:hypothetical protein